MCEPVRQPELLCAYCSLPPDGPMLGLLGGNAHIMCALLEIARLLDPEWEEGQPDPKWRFTTWMGYPLGPIDLTNLPDSVRRALGF